MPVTCGVPKREHAIAGAEDEIEGSKTPQLFEGLAEDLLCILFACSSVQNRAQTPLRAGGCALATDTTRVIVKLIMVSSFLLCG